MALLFMDGFDHYVSGDLGEKYNYLSSAAVSSTQARTGTQSMKDGYAGVSVPASGATAIVGFGIYSTNLSALVGCFINAGGFGTSTYQQVYIQITGDGAIAVFSGSALGTELGRTASGLVKLSMWHYLEAKVVLDPSTGSVTVKLNGSTVLTLTNKDTTGTPNVSTWTGVEIRASGYTYFDDLYVCDGSGSQNNDFIGECRVVTLLPQTDAVAAGSNADFTPSTGTDHGALVDENPPNDDTDYLSSSTVNHVDSWEYPALGYTGTIMGVQMNLSARKTDSGTRAIAAVTRPASTNRVHGTSHYLGTSYAYWLAIWELNPEDSAAWEVADINGAEFGVKVTV